MTDRRDNRPGGGGQRPARAAEPERVWLINVGLDMPVGVTASYPCVDETNYPGWTLLKNAEHKIVAMIRDGAANLIRHDQTSHDSGAGQ